MVNGRNRTTLSIPGTGISYVNESSNKKESTDEGTLKQPTINESFDLTSDENINSLDNEANNFEKSKKPKKNIKKILLILAGIIIALGLIGSLSEKKITDIKISSSLTTLDINNNYNITYTIEPIDAKSDSIEFISSDIDIVSLEKIEKDTISINTHKEGDVTLYVKYSNGTSNKLSISVEDKEKKIAEEKAKLEAKKAEEQRLADEKAEEQRLADEKAEREQAEANRKKVEEQAPIQTNTQEPTQQMVYSTKTGSKYHSNPNCGNTKNASLVTLGSARASGLTPCSKCY